jgi:outer membrane protein assembly factor BamB
VRELPPTTHCGWGTARARIAGLALVIAGTAAPLVGASGSIVPKSLPLTLQTTTTVPVLVPITPAITDRLVIVATAEGNVEARTLSAPAGTYWTRKFAAARLAAGDGLVYLATADRLIALDAETGADRWSAALQPDGARLVWRAGVLLISWPTGDVAALKTADGSQMWRVSLGAPLTAPPSADSILVVASLQNREVVALSMSDGTRRWTTALQIVPGALLVDGARAFVTGEDGSLLALKTRDGKVDWRQDRIGGRLAGPPVTDSRDVFVVTVDGLLTGYNKGNGALELTKPEKIAARAGALIDGAMIFMPLESGDVEGYLLGAGRPVPVAHLTAPRAADAKVSPAVLIAGSGEALRIVTLTESPQAWSMQIYAKGRLTIAPLTTLPGRPLPSSAPGGTPAPAAVPRIGGTD